jgi:hypothetical protein
MAPEDPMLRSMLMVMADHVRKVHEENERLHESIVHMRDWQKKTTHKLSALEVESHVKIRSLEQAHAEITQRWQHATSRLELNSAISSSAFSSQLHPSHYGLSTSASSSRLPLAPVATASRYRSEVEEVIERSLPFLRRFLSPSLIIKDHRYSSSSSGSLAAVQHLSDRAYIRSVLTETCVLLDPNRKPWILLRMSQPQTLDEIETPIIVYVSPAMCELVAYEAVRSFLLLKPRACVSTTHYTRTRMHSMSSMASLSARSAHRTARPSSTMHGLRWPGRARQSGSPSC